MPNRLFKKSNTVKLTPTAIGPLIQFMASPCGRAQRQPEQGACTDATRKHGIDDDDGDHHHHTYLPQTLEAFPVNHSRPHRPNVVPADDHRRLAGVHRRRNARFRSVDAVFLRGPPFRRQMLENKTFRLQSPSHNVQRVRRCTCRHVPITGGDKKGDVSAPSEGPGRDLGETHHFVQPTPPSRHMPAAAW